MHAHDRSSRTAAPGERKKPGRQVARDPRGLLALQRSVGNEAVTALLRAEERHVHGDGCGHDASVARTAVDAGLRSPGRPLDGATLARKESQFQADFSGVRVHSGPAAARAAAAVEAHAFTVHQDIVLGERGNDPEVLDHELTHVVRNQQGVTTGHDTGAGFDMTRPDDPAEREAAANAARMRSGGPSTVVGGTPGVARAPASAAVQRWAFVGGQQIAPDAEGLTPRMRQLAADELVHDYETNDEFRAHADGNTDYLGNLPGPASAGTWVRFARDGINVIGEQHTAVTLNDVLRAVGPASFVYEPFVTESLNEEPNTKSAYRTELRTTLDRFGMAPAADWTRHGAESMYPKMGHAMAQLLPYLRDPRELPKLTRTGADNHLGQQLQRYLKIAWQYGKDMRDQQNQQDQKPARTALVEEYTSVKHPETSAMAKVRGVFSKDLNDFVKALPHNGYLGDAFAAKGNARYIEPLVEYLKALIDELRERGQDDPVAPTTRPAYLQPGEPMNWDQKEADLGNRRDRHFQKAVTDAAAAGIRYAGMGMDHFQRLTAGPNWHLFDMRNVDLRRFEDLTRQRREQAQGGQQ